jgi:aspartyl-tRNA(Asn)/glutamyl-tRNA(Gln) amidotransferase subunit C
MEEKKDAAYFKQLAHQLMFDLSDEEAQNIVDEFDVLQKQLQLLDAVNTDGVEEMVYPFEDETTFIREDEVSNVISQEEALSNVDKKIEGHFVLPKVVK